MNCYSNITKTGADRYGVPVDFVQRAKTGSNRELKRHYGVGDKTLARWRKEANVPATSGRHVSVANSKMSVPTDFKDRAPRFTNKVLAEHYGVGDKTITRWRKETGCTAPLKSWNSAQLPKQFVPPIGAGEASEACQFLRPTHRPVYHRLIEGKEFKGQYVVGTKLFNEQQLIDYAREKGFKTGSEQLAAFDRFD